jgi:hypothetical protein
VCGISPAEPSGDPDLVLDGDTWHLAVWIVTAWEGDPRNLQPEEHDDLAWFDLAGVLALDFADPEYRDLLRVALG